MIEIACNEYFSGPNFLIYFNSVTPSVLRKRGVNGGGKFNIRNNVYYTRCKKKKKRKGEKKKKRGEEKKGERWDFY